MGARKSSPEKPSVSGSPVQGSMQRNGAPGFVHSARCRKPSGSTTIAEPPGASKRTERLETSFRTSAPASNISGFRGKTRPAKGARLRPGRSSPSAVTSGTAASSGRSKRSR